MERIKYDGGTRMNLFKKKRKKKGKKKKKSIGATARLESQHLDCPGSTTQTKQGVLEKALAAGSRKARKVKNKHCEKY